MSTAVWRLAASSWLERGRIEWAAHRRFLRLSQQIEAFDPGSSLPAALRHAAWDEARHGTMCQRVAAELHADAELAASVDEGAPLSDLSPRQQVLCELVSTSCLAEAESTVALGMLLPHAGDVLVHAVLRQLLSDEGRHAQLGWMHLERERSLIDVSFLSPLLPALLDRALSSALFTSSTLRPPEAVELLEYGVPTPELHRAAASEFLGKVLLPRLESAGLATAPLRTWLSSHAGSVSVAPPPAGGAATARAAP